MKRVLFQEQIFVFKKKCFYLGKNILIFPHLAILPRFSIFSKIYHNFEIRYLPWRMTNHSRYKIYFALYIFQENPLVVPFLKLCQKLKFVTKFKLCIAKYPVEERWYPFLHLIEKVEFLMTSSILTLSWRTFKLQFRLSVYDLLVDITSGTKRLK